MFYFQTNALGFSPEFLGRVRLAGSCASLVGVGVYNFALKDVPLRRMFLWTALLGTGLGPHAAAAHHGCACAPSPQGLV